MITMEFEEMKAIWDSQNNEAIYVINEKALHNRILSKKKQSNHITNTSELLAIITYFGGGCFILAVNFRHSNSVFMYLLAAWMICSAIFSLVSRLRRINGNGKYDRSMRGDLTHAIAMATYQVRLSLLMRWNIVPVGLLIVLGVWESGKSPWIALGIIIFFLVTNYAAGWEHRMYKNKLNELLILQTKLDNEDPGDHRS
ncbi:MAG: hypothetical protein ABIN94_21085 [Ferruginibacter sp.]